VVVNNKYFAGLIAGSDKERAAGRKAKLIEEIQEPEPPTTSFTIKTVCPTPIATDVLTE
jgi:hypothetical protein